VSEPIYREGPLRGPDPMERVKIGEVFHYFGKIGVAAIRLTDGALAVGDTIQVQGPSTDVTQVVETMQIEHDGVTRAERGQEVGVRLKDRARERDLVYKVLPS
jgi:translation initiation factor IF-2